MLLRVCRGRRRCIAQAALVEVKGQRDKLADRQRAWAQLLLSAGVDVHVCKVRDNGRRSQPRC